MANVFFKEGLIMFISNESSRELGVSVTCAMVIHNLMEGLLIALPFYYATRSQFAAFGYASLLGGLSQPLGALIGLVAIRHVDKESKEIMFGVIFGIISGMMYMILMKVLKTCCMMTSLIFYVFRVCFHKPLNQALAISMYSHSLSQAFGSSCSFHYFNLLSQCINYKYLCMNFI